MDKENSVTSNISELPIRVTRARAAAYRASMQIPPSTACIPQEQRQSSRPYLKRPALERNSQVSVTTVPPRKKRAVLKDVANIVSQSLCTNCMAATQVDVLQICLLSLF